MQEILVCAVMEQSQIGEARRRSAELAERLGFGETDCGRLALIVTELAANLVRHAEQGQLLFSSLASSSLPAIQVLSLDKGPGMRDPDTCLRDGYSTAGTPGKGLGAVLRLSDELDIYTAPGFGTAIVVNVHSRSRSAEPSEPQHPLTVGAVSIPIAGEEVCGDGWSLHPSPRGYQVMVADGLGHGGLAADAARTALRIFGSCAGRRPTEILEAAHAGMKATRGAAVAVAELDTTTREVRFAGVGNIAGCIVTAGRSQSMVSHNGTVGHQFRKAQEFVYAWPQDALLILHSDGLSTQWRLDRYPGLALRDPALVAGVLFRDFVRGRDDVTVVAIRETATGVSGWSVGTPA